MSPTTTPPSSPSPRATPRLLALALLVPLLGGCISPSDPATPGGPMDGAALPIALRFLEPVDLVCPTEGPGPILDLALACGYYGEPVIEVAGNGDIWASASCCPGRSPPIWVSRDGGESFTHLPFADGTGVVRDAFGIEGDFAIDDAGNVYFFDISLASGWLTKFQADGTHVFTKAEAFEPSVDRPWVRAGAADEVWAFYNTLTSTRMYYSTNGGLTWTLTPLDFGCNLMTPGQGPARDRIFVAGCRDDPILTISTDGGKTFGERIQLPVPAIDGVDDPGAIDHNIPPASDAAGNIYVTFTVATDPGGNHSAIALDIVRPDGSVAGPFIVSGDGPWCELPWVAGGKAGVAAVAFYCADRGRDEADDAVWHVYVAVVTHGGADQPTISLAKADPEPVLKGDLGVVLGDFMQTDIGPDGRLYTAYAKQVGASVINRVVITDGVDLGPGVPHNGPLP